MDILADLNDAQELEELRVERQQHKRLEEELRER